MENTGFWAENIAERVVRRSERVKGPSRSIICASGISPSGNIHLGNLREIVTVHIVAEVLRRWGYHVKHVHSWDDYDRLRRIPNGVPETFGQHIGKPLSETPDPFGEFPSYADRFITDFEESMEKLGISAEILSNVVDEKCSASPKASPLS